MMKFTETTPKDEVYSECEIDPKHFIERYRLVCTSIKNAVTKHKRGESYICCLPFHNLKVLLTVPVLDSLLQKTTGGKAKSLPRDGNPATDDPKRNLRLLSFVIYKCFDVSERGKLDRLISHLLTQAKGGNATYLKRFDQAVSFLKVSLQDHESVTRRRTELETSGDGDLCLTLITSPTMALSETDDDDDQSKGTQKEKRKKTRGMVDIDPVWRRALAFCARHLADGVKVSLRSLGYTMCMLFVVLVAVVWGLGYVFEHYLLFNPFKWIPVLKHIAAWWEDGIYMTTASFVLHLLQSVYLIPIDFAFGCTKAYLRGIRNSTDYEIALWMDESRFPTSHTSRREAALVVWSALGTILVLLLALWATKPWSWQIRVHDREITREGETPEVSEEIRNIGKRAGVSREPNDSVGKREDRSPKRSAFSQADYDQYANVAQGNPSPASVTKPPPETRLFEERDGVYSTLITDPQRFIANSKIQCEDTQMIADIMRIPADIFKLIVLNNFTMGSLLSGKKEFASVIRKLEAILMPNAMARLMIGFYTFGFGKWKDHLDPVNPFTWGVFLARLRERAQHDPDPVAAVISSFLNRFALVLGIDTKSLDNAPELKGFLCKISYFFMKSRVDPEVDSPFSLQNMSWVLNDFKNKFLEKIVGFLSPLKGGASIIEIERLKEGVWGIISPQKWSNEARFLEAKVIPLRLVMDSYVIKPLRVSFAGNGSSQSAACTKCVNYPSIFASPWIADSGAFHHERNCPLDPELQEASTLVKVKKGKSGNGVEE
jgi:hypothetical protein